VWGSGGRRECPAAEMRGAAVSAQLAPYLRGTQLAQDRAAAAHGQMEQEQHGVGMEGFRKWFWLEQRGEWDDDTVRACACACACTRVCVRARACVCACARVRARARVPASCACVRGGSAACAGWRWVALCAPVRLPPVACVRGAHTHMSPVPLGSHLIRRRSRLRAWQAVREVFARVDVDRGGTLDIDEVEEAAEL
jgi:hypothetical protein